MLMPMEPTFNIYSNNQACPREWGFPWEMSHGMGWDGTARIAFPMGPMGQ